MEKVAQFTRFLKDRVRDMLKEKEYKKELLTKVAGGGLGLNPATNARLTDPEATRRFLEDPDKYRGSVPVSDLETIVLLHGRPVLLVQNDSFRAEFAEPQSEFWKDRLETAR